MTVYNDIERALAMAEAAKGNYLLFAIDSEDEKAEKVFKEMAEDMERHVKILESRMDYLSQYNQLNAKNGGGGGKKEKKQQNGDQEEGS